MAQSAAPLRSGSAPAAAVQPFAVYPLSCVGCHADAYFFGANPYGCNGAAAQAGVLELVARWVLSRLRSGSLLRLLKRGAEGLRMLKKGISVKDPTGKELRLTYDIFKHWVRAGKKLSDIRMRFKNLNRAIMAIRQPNEIWQSEKGERIYLSMQQEEVNGKKRGSKKRSLQLLYPVEGVRCPLITRGSYELKQKEKGNVCTAGNDGVGTHGQLVPTRLATSSGSASVSGAFRHNFRLSANAGEERHGSTYHKAATA